jgi:hypothetical protein
MDEKNVGPVFAPEKISKTWSFGVSYGTAIGQGSGHWVLLSAGARRRRHSAKGALGGSFCCLKIKAEILLGAIIPLPVPIRLDLLPHVDTSNMPSTVLS